MSTITKEQLIAKAREQIAFCSHTKITGEGRTHVNQCSALFEIALAALTAPPAPVELQERRKAEPIYQLWDMGFYDTDKETYDALASSSARARIVYTAPPAPVSVPEEMADTFIAAIEKEQDRLFGQDYLMDSKDCIDVIREEITRIKARRAAMLQGAEQTNYRTIVERIAEIVHGKVTDIDLLTVTVKSMKDKLHK